MTATTNYNNSQPSLLPLFFHEKGEVSVLESNNTESMQIPPEILHHCLIEYANWGDLAKLACVQKQWSQVMMEAASTNIQSKWNLAQALLQGTCGLSQNHKTAMKLLLELANVKMNNTNNNNNMPSNESEDTTLPCFAPAMKEIAKCYFEGNGVEQSAEIGMAWLQSSFEIGNDINVAHDIALMYEKGTNGIELDVVAAAQWLGKAAEKGHVEAMCELALCYELGCGVEQSDELSLDWYMKAANEGHLCAKYSIGEAYEEARGVPQSDEEACLWYYRAARQGDEDSKTALRRLRDIARIVVPGAATILNE